MHNTDRQPRMLTPDLNDEADEAARNVVFTLGAPKVILIKIDAKVNLGLPPASAPTPEQQKQKREGERAVAAKYGIDSQAYRDDTGKEHNGKRVIEGASRVRLSALIADLTAAGYKLTRAVWFQKPARAGKRQPDPTQQFTFALDGEAIEMTPAIKAFLDEVFVDNFHVWSNPKMADDGTPFRLDTLNGPAGQRPKQLNAGNGGQPLRFQMQDAPTESGYLFED